MHLPFFFILSFSLGSQAAVERGLFFFRTPKSPFPSGQMSKTDLERTKLSQVLENSYLITRERKTFWWPAEKVLRDIDLSGNKTINVISCAIRQGPDWNHKILLQIPALTKLDFLGIRNSWAKVRFVTAGSQVIGFVDLNNLVLEADFASFVLTEENQWRPVKFRELAYFITDKNERLAIDQVKRMVTRPDLGIIAVKDDKMGLSIKNHVIIKKMEDGNWNLSEVPGHGRVYWQNPTAISNEEDFINTDELLKREVHSIAFHPKNPRWGLVSAGGIYLTLDGQRWQKLKAFRQNEPVSIDKEGTMIVGSQMSRDYGKTFHPYVRWEKIARLIEINEAKPAAVMHIADLHFDKHGFLILTIDNGVKKLKMAGVPSEQTSWRMLNQ
jgi:hypothetical protein